MQVTFGETMQSVLKHADALIIVTEWKAFRSPDFACLKQALKDAVIFDGRNLYATDVMEEKGFSYFSIGRKPVNLNA